jgi:hypothetical protein
VTLSGITHAERAGWQRRAAAELARILDAHRDLPVIAWTVGPAGATLIGKVNPFAPEAEVRQVFDAWRVALMLDEFNHTIGGGTIHLRSTADRNRVGVGLSATVFSDAESEG